VVVVTGFHPNGIIYGPAALTKLTWTLLINCVGRWSQRIKASPQGRDRTAPPRSVYGAACPQGLMLKGPAGKAKSGAKFAAERATQRDVPDGRSTGDELPYRNPRLVRRGPAGEELIRG